MRKSSGLMMAALLAAAGTAEAFGQTRRVINPYEKLVTYQSDEEANDALIKAQEKRDRKAAKRTKNAKQEV